MNEKDINLQLTKIALKKYDIDFIANNLNISKSTIKRWLLLENVPSNYHFDLCRLLNIKIDYSKYSAKEKDQFYTKAPVAEYCFEVIKNKLKSLEIDEEEYFYIEPSAGAGSFLNLLPKNRSIGIDIEPMADNIIKMNYLDWKPKTNKNIVIGNPPFGLRGHLALKFINHSYEFSDFVAFILPQFFESDGKGTPMNRVKGFNLIHSEKIDSCFEYPDGNEVKINVVFHIWAKKIKNEDKKTNTCKEYIKIYSLSNGGTPSSTRNVKMLDKCNVYLPSTCFGEEKMKLYNSFENLPNKKGYGIVFLKETKNITKIFQNIKWNEKSFQSTNSAYNLRSSIIENAVVESGVKDGLD